MLKELPDDGLENRARDVMIRQLRRNLKSCRKIMLDEKLDLKTRERWTQLYNNTSTVLNQVLKDRQMRDYERRLRIIEENEGEQSGTTWEQSDSKSSETIRQEAARSNEPIEEDEEPD